MKLSPFKPFVWLILFVAAVGLACSFGSQPATQAPPVQEEQATEAPAPTEAPTQVPADEPEPQESGAVNNLQDVKSAVVQIESQGTFVDPQVGLVLNGAGRGSGFIIDPSGIAVTNNHVVTGAALLKVWVGGDTGRSYNARVLGVSECSDLAVIDIDGDGFPYLEWHPGPIDVGMDLYVAGFPLGDPEYTLTRGVVSKANANGELGWSSVDSVIEFDANANPGNSGGPVITPDGNVLAVLYSGNADTRQFFGISRDEAVKVIDQLRTGKNVDSIGINGQAVVSDDGTLSGIWVSSVQSGSPADQAGVKAGDIVTELENLILATDGTMSDYCDIIRSHSSEDTLNIQVLRWAESMVLDGQLNGRDLEVSFTYEPVDNSDPGTEGGQTSSTTVLNLDASAPGDVYLVTDFDDSENWYTFSVPDGDDYEATLENSTLFVEVNARETTAYAIYDLDILNPDVRVDAAVETVSGPNRNNISLICRGTEDGWYEFSMNSGGYWYIWKYDDGQYTNLKQGASYAINLQRAKNEIAATCIGTELTFYVNGEEMGSVTDNRFKGGGQVGVSVSTFDISGAGVEFDWFIASIP